MREDVREVGSDGLMEGLDGGERQRHRMKNLTIERRRQTNRHTRAGNLQRSETEIEPSLMHSGSYMSPDELRVIKMQMGTTDGEASAAAAADGDGGGAAAEAGEADVNAEAIIQSHNYSEWTQVAPYLLPPQLMMHRRTPDRQAGGQTNEWRER